MFHVYKLGRDGCKALANDFDRFRETGKPISKESVRYAGICEKRWSSFATMTPQSAVMDAKFLLELYQSGSEPFPFVVHLLFRVRMNVNLPRLPGRINRINSNNLRRSAVASLAEVLCVKNNTLHVRNRDEWSVRLQLAHAGMLTKYKDEYEWEELPSGNNDRGREKPKPGSLNDVDA